jgi:DNA-binding cell septation regulator SpoVG
MFSYRFKIRKLNRTSSKLKAFVTIVIDDIMELHNFKIIEGSNGLFVTPPSHKGAAVVDGIEVEKYYDDITFTGEEGVNSFREIKEQILSEYSSSSSIPIRGASANAHAKKFTKPSEDTVSKKQLSPESKPDPIPSKEENAPERTRKPLWGF